MSQINPTEATNDPPKLNFAKELPVFKLQAMDSPKFRTRRIPRAHVRSSGNKGDIENAKMFNRFRKGSILAPPEGEWGWVVVAGSAMIFFLGGGLSRSFTLIYQQLITQFGQSAAATSATAAIFGIVKMCSSPLVSMMCYKFSKRKIAVVGGFLAGIAMVMTSFPLSLPYLYVTYGILAAFGLNMVLTPCFVIIGEYFRVRRARAMSLSMLGGSLGGIILPHLLNFLFDHYGYSGAMLIFSGLMFHLCVAAALFRSVPLRNRMGHLLALANAAKLTQQFEDSQRNSNGTISRDGDASSMNSERRDSERASHQEFDKEDCCKNKPSNGISNGHDRLTVPVIKPQDSFSDCSMHSDRRDSENIGSDQETEKDESWKGRNSNRMLDRDTLSVPSRKHQDSLSDGSINETNNADDTASNADRSSRRVKIIEPPKRHVSFHVTNDMQIDQENTNMETDEQEEKEKKRRKSCFASCRTLCKSVGFHLLKKPRFLSYSLLMMGSIMSLSVSGTFLSGLVRDIGYGDTETGIMLSVSAAIDIPSKFASGFIFDLGKIRPYRSIALAGLGFLTGGFGVAMGLVEGYFSLFVVYLFQTFFASAYHTQHATVLGDLVGSRNLAGAMGICRLFQGIGFTLGPTIGGHLKDVTGKYQSAYIFCGSVLLCFTFVYTFVDLWLLWREKRKEAREDRMYARGHVARYRHDSISTT